jgi:hypothetical protein
MSNGLAGAPGPNPTQAIISNAIIECAFDGIFLDAFPPVTFEGDGNLIQNNLNGVQSWGGAFKPSHTQIVRNFFGVQTKPSEPTLGVDLGGGGNQVSCNGALESGLTNMWTGPGMNLSLPYGSSPTERLNVANTAWNHWDSDAGSTQVWRCDDGNYTSCTCSGASSCPAGPAGPLPAGADVVYVPITGTTGLDLDQSNGSAAADGCP